MGINLIIGVNTPFNPHQYHKLQNSPFPATTWIQAER